MLGSLAGNPTAVELLVARSARATGWRLAAVLFAAGLTAAAAQVSFPLPWTPVPLTLQPLAVLLSAAALGARLGLAAQCTYLAAGLAGLPVFAWAPGLPQGAARLVGPTGGYLLAFPVAAWVTGRLAELGFDRRYPTAVLAMAAGLAVIFAGGVAWIGLLKPDPVGFGTALQIGVYPFLATDAIKVLVAAALLPAWRRWLGRGELSDR
jgi:biotin transport system substrate-specific component